MYSQIAPLSGAMLYFRWESFPYLPLYNSNYITLITTHVQEDMLPHNVDCPNSDVTHDLYRHWTYPFMEYCACVYVHVLWLPYFHN